MSACTAAVLETGNRCSRESVNSRASVTQRPGKCAPNSISRAPALRLFSKAQTGYGALTLIKAPAVSPAVPTTSAEAAKKTDNSKAGRGKH